MREEPTFQIGEIALTKGQTHWEEGTNVPVPPGTELEILSKRGYHEHFIFPDKMYFVRDGYRFKRPYAEGLLIGIVEHSCLERKRRPDELPSQHSYHDLLTLLKESTPCESNTPLTTSEPQEAESLTLYSINPQTNERGESPLMTLVASQRLQEAFPATHSWLKRVWLLTKAAF